MNIECQKCLSVHCEHNCIAVVEDAVKLLKTEITELSEKRGDAGLRLLFEIQDLVPEAGIASGLRLGAEIMLKHFKDLRVRVKQLESALDKIIEKDGPGLDCSPPGPCYDIAKIARYEDKKL